MCGITGQRREIDGFLVPTRGVRRGVGRCDEGREAGVVRGVDGGVGGTQLVDWSGCSGDVWYCWGCRGGGCATLAWGGLCRVGGIPERSGEGDVDLFMM